MKSFTRSPAFVLPVSFAIATIYAVIIFQMKTPTHAWLILTFGCAIFGGMFGYGLARPAQRYWQFSLGFSLSIATLIFHFVRVTIPMITRLS